MSRTKASLLLIFVFMARGTSFLFSKTLMSEPIESDFDKAVKRMIKEQADV